MSTPTVQSVVPSPIAGAIAVDRGDGVLGGVGKYLPVADASSAALLADVAVNLRQLCALMVWLKEPAGIDPPIVPGSCLDGGQP